jgi:hypothetical protein
MLRQMIVLAGEWKFEEEKLGQEYSITNAAFGKTAIEIFKKPQAIFGFAVALQKLIEREDYRNAEEVRTILSEIKTGNDYAFDTLIKRLDEIKNESKIAIGSAQRLFFKRFFFNLFYKRDNTYLNLHKSIEQAVKDGRSNINSKTKKQKIYE